MKSTEKMGTAAKNLMLAGTLFLSTMTWAQSSSAWTRAEVRKVDVDNGKITLKHEEIKSLDMPPMTMVFRVSSPTLLEGVKAGDFVQFTAEQRDGGIVVTDLKSTTAPPRPAAKPVP